MANNTINWGQGSVNNTINWGTGAATAGSFDADYQAVLDRSTALGYTEPSAAQQTLQNTLVTDFKNCGGLGQVRCTIHYG